MQLTVNFQLSAPEILERLDKIVATLANILAADTTLKTDVAALQTLVTQLIAAFSALAAGSITPAQATTLLADLQADDTTATGAIKSIQTALGTTPPPPGP